MAKSEQISANYLVQLLIELKAQGIVKSVRGKEGGYFLARPPAEITMADVLRCFHGEVFDSPGADDPTSPPEIKAAWQSLKSALEASAEQITLQSIMEESASRTSMYYI